jgi:hypothetical protein
VRVDKRQKEKMRGMNGERSLHPRPIHEEYSLCRAGLVLAGYLQRERVSKVFILGLFYAIIDLAICYPVLVLIPSNHRWICGYVLKEIVNAILKIACNSAIFAGFVKKSSKRQPSRRMSRRESCETTISRGRKKENSCFATAMPSAEMKNAK